MLLRATTAGVSTAWMDVFWRLWAHVEPRPWLRAAWARTRHRRPGRLRGPRASTFLIDRYLIREYTIFLGFGLAMGAVLFIVVDLLQTLDRFLRVKPSFELIVQHFLYNLPPELYKGLPIIVLIATVFLFLSLSRQRELDAFKAAGISLYRVSLPILLTAGVISIGAVIFQEAALPELNAKAEEVDNVKIRGRVPRHLQRQSQIWYRASDTRFFRMALLDPVEKSMDGLLLLEIDRDFRVVNRLDATKAQWTPDGWNVTAGPRGASTPRDRVWSETFDRRRIAMPEHIDDFTQIQKLPGCHELPRAAGVRRASSRRAAIR